MKISIITENSTLVEFLKNNPSLKVENCYTDLNSQYEKFISDLNQVDTLLLIDYTDLGQNLSKLITAVSTGNSYLLKVDEILIITYKDYTLSPTVGAEDRFKAFSSMMLEYKYKVRIVQLDSIDFSSVYDSVIKETTLSENSIQIYTKYKVTTSSGGVNLKPKKTKLTLVPDKPNDLTALKEQDKLTSAITDSNILKVPNDKDKIYRTNPNLTIIKTINQNSVPLILVSGLKYSGKTTFILNVLKELSKNGFSALGIDATGARDFSRLQRFSKTSFPVLSGESIFNNTEDSTTLIELLHESPTSSFISSVNHIVSNKVCIFCELNITNIDNYMSTYLGSRKVYIITEYDFTKLRDLSLSIRKEMVSINIIVNVRDSNVSEEIMENTIREFIPHVDTIGFFSDFMDIVLKLGVC